MKNPGKAQSTENVHEKIEKKLDHQQPLWEPLLKITLHYIASIHENEKENKSL